MAEMLEVNGIEVPFDKAKLGDMRFIVLLGDLNDEELPDDERLVAQSRVMRFLFGNDRARILDAIAEGNGGQVSADAFTSWLAAYFEAANLKN